KVPPLFTQVRAPLPGAGPLSPAPSGCSRERLGYRPNGKFEAKWRQFDDGPTRRRRSVQPVGDEDEPALALERLDRGRGGGLAARPVAQHEVVDLAFGSRPLEDVEGAVLVHGDVDTGRVALQLDLGDGVESPRFHPPDTQGDRVVAAGRVYLD